MTYWPPTIGILTALDVECVAAGFMLDGLIKAPPPAPHDRSSYWRGTVPSADSARPHQVVLSTLVDDGGNSAANACANMQVTWGVTEIVMCGIACGVPAPDDPDRHVRLGDILVADHGVVPYGHLRVRPRSAEIRRQVSRPSVNLRRAAASLRIAAETGVAPWEALLDKASRIGPPAYRRPAPNTDVLHDDRTGAPTTHPVQPARHASYPMVHYGPIGSGGKLLRDPGERNRLAKRYGLVGFDMEGDGVADSTYLQGVNWFMVRGVSDYGDDHKNDVWRRYAAMTAAAYVRALLGLLPHPGTPSATATPTAGGPPAVAGRTDEIAAILLAMSGITERRTRDAIVVNLPDDVRHLISRSPAVRSDVIAIVRTMLDHPQGLHALARAVRSAGNAMAARQLELLNQGFGGSA
jgi:nucleoside phosphorylase